MNKSAICAFLCVISLIVKGQGDQFGLKTGINLSIFSASVNSESSFKSGIHVGFYWKTPLSKNFFFCPELYYSRQGQKDDYQAFSGGSIGKTTTIMNYINAPFLFEAGRKVTFQFGPQFGVLLNGREKGIISNKKIDDNLKDVMSKVDLSLVVGLGVAPSDKFNFGLRTNIGMNDIYKGDQNLDIPGEKYPNIKNRVIQVYVAFAF